MRRDPPEGRRLERARPTIELDELALVKGQSRCVAEVQPPLQECWVRRHLKAQGKDAHARTLKTFQQMTVQQLLLAILK